jgi:flagellin
MMAQSALAGTQRDLGKSLTKLSTGVRINSASDDAAGLGVSERLRTQVRGLSQAKRNAQDGIALMQIAEGAAGQVTDILQRMRELSVQSASDTLTSTERTYTNQEFSNLMNEIQRVSQSTQYNGQTLLDGESTSFGSASSASSVLQIGANNTSGVDTLTISISSVTVGALGMTLSGAGQTNVTSSANASSAISTIDSAIASVSSMRSNLGASINRLESAINNLDNQEYNTQSAESQIRDVDFATETTNFTKSQILMQSATSMLSQANSLPQSVLALLG